MREKQWVGLSLDIEPHLPTPPLAGKFKCSNNLSCSFKQFLIVKHEVLYQKRKIAKREVLTF